MTKATKNGFTLVEIMIVVAVIGLMATLAIPSFLKARNTAQQNACINNLRQIDNAKEQAAFGYALADGSSIVDASVNEYMRKGAPSCPGGGTYTYNIIGADPSCSVASPTLHMLE